MGIIKDKLNEQIQANNLRTYSDTTGIILDYDAITNRAKIKFYSPIGEGVMVRENVPISSQSGGFTQCGIHIGMQCNISFYNNKTCSDQGACLVNETIKSIQKPKEITPMSSQWLDENNQNESKYNNDLGMYQNIDVTAETMDMLTKLDRYTDTEQGITNLETKSTIKLRENGDIDIFVSNNIGIRISESNKKIYIYGDLIINGEKYEPINKQDLNNIIN